MSDKYSVYKSKTAARLGKIVEACCDEEPNDIDFLFDLALPDGFIQYLVRAELDDSIKFYAIRLCGTSRSSDLKNDIDEIDVESWPPPKFKPKTSSFVVKFKT